MVDVDAYAEGVDAAHSGKCAADCPYDAGTLQYDEWLQGYQDGGGTD